MVGSKDCPFTQPFKNWAKNLMVGIFKAAVYYRKCIPYPRNPVKVEIIANNV